MGELGRRGKEADPIVNVRVSDGWAGGLAGSTDKVRSPEANGKGDEVGVGRWSAVHWEISTRALIFVDVYEESVVRVR